MQLSLDTLFTQGGTFIERHFGQSIWTDLPIAIALFIGMIVVLVVMRHAVLQRLHVLSKKTTSTLDDVLIDVCRKISSPFFVAASLFVSVQHLNMPDALYTGIKGFFLVMLVYEAVKVLERVCMYFINRELSDGKVEKKSSHAISIFVRIVLWCIGFLLIVSNLGMNVGSLIAGLGIGGLAISLALQNVLSDLFSSFSIIIDKPFEEGDYIDLGGGYDGTVKKIGLKSTRIEALHGEELVVPNAELTSSKIQNYKRMERRREVVIVGITYETPSALIKDVPHILEDLANNVKEIEFDRSAFISFGDSSLNFELVFYVLDRSKKVGAAKRQEVQFAIIDAFEQKNIQFAYPTQTLYIEKK